MKISLNNNIDVIIIKVKLSFSTPCIYIFLKGVLPILYMYVYTQFFLEDGIHIFANLFCPCCQKKKYIYIYIFFQTPSIHYSIFLM